MGKKNQKKKRKQIVKYESKTISEERLVEIHEEAYYRALKRIEQEKQNVRDPLVEKAKDKWWEKIFFFFNVLFFPWKIHKRFRINNHIYDYILSLVVSGVYKILGVGGRLIGVVVILYGIYYIIHFNNQNIGIGFIAIGFALLLWGSIFVIAGNAFAKEKDSGKIYAYSASVIALISCILSLIAVLKR